MVGLPFANIKSPELKEKMDYLNATMVSIHILVNQSITDICVASSGISRKLGVLIVRYSQKKVFCFLLF